MIRLLLGSETYLWWLADDPQLGSQVRTAMWDPSTVVFVSSATIWELAIKARLGRVELNGADLASEIAANGFMELPISALHAAHAAALPNHLDNPFDRMLVAQAQLEGLTCATRDEAFSAYDVPVLW